MPADRDSAAAVWFDAGGSRRVAATLWIGGGVLHVENDAGERRHAPLDEVRVSSRLANLPRRLQLPDGVTLTVDDNDFVDHALPRRRAAALHALESRWGWLLGLTAAAAAVVLVAYQSLLPAAADALAARVPPAYLREITTTVFNNLHEQDVLNPTRLSAAQQQRAQRLFAAVAAEYPSDEYELRLLSRRFFFDAPNAFALPDGMIIVTDEAARLLNDDELTAVFAHEVGHVVRRHSMRLLVRFAGLSSLVFFLLGDFSGLSLAPIYVAQLQYSRDFEREADCFAYAHLTRSGMAPTLIGEALLKMEGEMEQAMRAHAEEEEDDAPRSSSRDSVDDGDEGGAADDAEVIAHGGAAGEAAAEAKDDGGGKTAWLTLIEALSTHPQTEERLDLSRSCDGDGSARG